MRTSIKGALAAIVLTGLLAGCASYDYGYDYAYDRPYYGYGYDYGPYYYGYGPYAYGPGYYYGAPSVGFNLGFRDFDRRDRYDRRDYGRRDRSYRRGSVRAQQRTNTRPARGSRDRQPAATYRHHGAPPRAGRASRTADAGRRQSTRGPGDAARRAAVNARSAGGGARGHDRR